MNSSRISNLFSRIDRFIPDKPPGIWGTFFELQSVVIHVKSDLREKLIFETEIEAKGFFKHCLGVFLA